jgi:hypothetical protein
LQHDLKTVETSYGQNVLNLTVARGYVRKLLDNPLVVRFLTTQYAEILAELTSIIAAESL